MKVKSGVVCKQLETESTKLLQNYLATFDVLGKEKRELSEMRSWLLHHDNARAQNCLGIWEFLAKKKEMLPRTQPRYFSDAPRTLHHR